MKKGKKAPPVFDMNEIMHDPDKKAQLAGFVDELVEALQKLDGIQHEIKGLRDAAKETLGIPPKRLNRLLKESLEVGYIAGEVRELEETQTLSDAIKT